MTLAPTQAELAAQRARLEALLVRKRTQATMLRRSPSTGESFQRKRVGKSGQVVIPIHVLERWSVARDGSHEVILLDLEWGVLLMPASEARLLIEDLDPRPE